MHFPGWLQLDVEGCVAVVHEGGDRGVEHVDVFPEAGGELHAEAAVDDFSEFQQHFVDWFQVSGQRLKNKLQILQEVELFEPSNPPP